MAHEGSNAAFDGGPTVPIPPAQREGDQFGRYTLLHKIGKGGFGYVWLAEERGDLRRRVAIKFLREDVHHPEYRARFQQEAQALAVMEHPCIAQIYDYGFTPRGEPYFVMEFIRGVTLTEFCDSRELSIRDRLQIFRKICDGVQYAHNKGIVHRDLKPLNILVGLPDGAERLESIESVNVKVIDFGIAKSLRGPLIDTPIATDAGRGMGSLGYVAPEQARPNIIGVDTRADVYSLGVILYELLAGHTPYTRDQLQAASMKGMYDFLQRVDPPPPSTRVLSAEQRDRGPSDVARVRKCEINELIIQLRKELEWIPLKAMARLPDDRYRSPAELSDEVQRYLEGRPLVAGPRTFWYYSKKVARLYSIPIAVCALIVLSLVGGVVTTMWQANIARVAEASALRDKQRAEWGEYRSTLLAVEGAIDRREYWRARGLLDAMPTSFRSWEYAFLDSLIPDANAGVVTEDLVQGMSAAPDRIIAVGHLRNSTFDPRTHAETPLPYIMPGGEIAAAVAWSPDCRFALEVTLSGTRCFLVDVLAGKVLRELPVPPGVGAIFGAVNPAADRACIGRRGGEAVSLIDLATGSIVARLPACNAAAFSPDAESVVIADASLSQFAAADGARLPSLAVSTCSEPARMICISSDGSLLLASSPRGTELWDLKPGGRRWVLPFAASGLAFDQDAKVALLAREFEVESVPVGAPALRTTARFAGEVKRVGALTGTNQRWVSTLVFGENRLHRIEAGATPAQVQVPGIERLLSSPTATSIAAVCSHPDASNQRTLGVRVFNASDLSETAAIDGVIGPPGFAPDGRSFAIACRDADGSISVKFHGGAWRSASELPADAASTRTVESRVGVALSPDSSRMALLIAGDTRYSLHIGDVANGTSTKLGEWPVGDNPDVAARIVGLAFSPDGKFVVATLAGEVCLVRLGSNPPGQATILPVGGSPELVQFSPDSRWCAVASVAGALHLIDTQHSTIKPLEEIEGTPTSAPLTGLAWTRGATPRLVHARVGSLAVWNPEGLVFRGALPPASSCAVAGETGDLLLATDGVIKRLRSIPRR